MPLNTPLLRFKQLLKKLNALFLNYFLDIKNRIYRFKKAKTRRFDHGSIENIKANTVTSLLFNLNYINEIAKNPSRNDQTPPRWIWFFYL